MKRKRSQEEEIEGEKEEGEDVLKKRKLNTNTISFVQKKNHEIYDFYMGLRLAKPFRYVFKSNAKGRWFGKRVLEIYCKEFVGYDANYWKREIALGRVQINNQNVTCSTTIKQHDVLTHVIHRHELPVIDLPIEFIHSDKDLMILNKSPSVPVHPCGKYCHNSITKILANEYSFDPTTLFPVHRLDRVTSGVLIFARTKRMAQEKYQAIVTHNVRKIYVAKVDGCDFPLNELKVVNERMECIDKRRGMWGIVKHGKYPSLSYVLGVAKDEKTNTSLVLVRLITGKTHQVRIHMAHLGHPVCKDAMYGNGARKPVFDHGHKFDPKYFDDDCWDCKNLEKEWPMYEPESLTICLHSWKYVGKDFNVCANLPEWAYPSISNEILEERLVELEKQIVEFEKENTVENGLDEKNVKNIIRKMKQKREKMKDEE